VRERERVIEVFFRSQKRKVEKYTWGVGVAKAADPHLFDRIRGEVAVQPELVVLHLHRRSEMIGLAAPDWPELKIDLSDARRKNY